MRELAYSSGKVPPRYQVEPGALSKEKKVIACGAFADIRRGTLGGKTVAVKTLRTGLEGNHQDPQKVRAASECFSKAH